MVRKQGQGGKGQRGASAGCRSRPEAATGHKSEPREARLGSGGQGEEGERARAWGRKPRVREGRQEATAPRLHRSPRNSKNKDVLLPERAGCCQGEFSLSAEDKEPGTQHRQQGWGVLLSQAQRGSPSLCTPFRWASLGSALSRGPWGTDAQHSTGAMPWLWSRSKKAAEMLMESHWVPRQKQSRSTGRRRGESREVLACGRLDWTEPGRDSREREGRGAADRCHRWGSGSGGRGRQGPGLSPVFAILDGGLAEAGPLQEWGIPASVCAGGEDAVLWGRRGRAVSQKTKVVTKPAPSSPFYHEQWEGVGVGGEKRCCFDSGGQGFL